MSDQWLGEIRAVGFAFPPKGWARCDGSLMPISQNTALFSLLGTTYGGNGTSTFALPDLRGRVAVGSGQGTGLSDYVLGEEDGEEAHTLVGGEIPAHTHLVNAAPTAATTANPTQGFYAVPIVNSHDAIMYSASQDLQLAPDAVSTTGGHTAHENRQPYTSVLYIIALSGIFPSRS